MVAANCPKINTTTVRFVVRSWSFKVPSFIKTRLYSKGTPMPSYEFISNLNQLHAVSRTHQGRQKEPSVKTLRCPLSGRVLEALRVEWRNSTPHFPLTPERRNENINVNKYFISSKRIEPTTSRFNSHTSSGLYFSKFMAKFHVNK